MTHPGPSESAGGDPYGPSTGGAWGQGQPPVGGQPPYAGQPPYVGQPPYGGHPPAYGQPYGYGFPPPQRTNGMAIASLVLGILWLYWIGSILALVFGYVARKQIRERGDSGDGMAIAGIVLGWVGVGILGIALIAAIGASV